MVFSAAFGGGFAKSSNHGTSVPVYADFKVSGPEMAVGGPDPGPLVNQKLLIDHTFDSELEPVIAR